MATPQETPNDTNLVPLTDAARVLKKHGVTLCYQALWARCASASIPHVRIKNRVFLAGDMGEIARILQEPRRQTANRAQGEGAEATDERAAPESEIVFTVDAATAANLDKFAGALGCSRGAAASHLIREELRHRLSPTDAH